MQQHHIFPRLKHHSQRITSSPRQALSGCATASTRHDLIMGRVRDFSKFPAVPGLER